MQTRENLDENVELVRKQFENCIPDTFQLIGFLNQSKIIAVNEKNNKIHAFHYADLADLSYLKQLVKTPICSINGFMKDLEPQTMICLVSPDNNTKYECLKFSKNHLYHEIEDRQTEDWMYSREELLEEYFNRINIVIDKGYTILYGPQFVWDKFKNT